ncbi:putative mitochondrial protein AtMg00860 [Nicotiana tabacum]|uniref:Mitochondrial protein AtMg00860 n=1 Tax=Nicotiana tabacum TaxID=4097 RepID=A0A1S4BRC8_TOBAC|nr:PREDICTED: uncharacterized mitochondrial protein AtMg00860-like [Nicotiana tabacum]
MDEYLGHYISAAGATTDSKKIEAIQAWSDPANLKQLRGFLGLAGYYKSGPEAFNKLKNALTSAPVLVLPDFSMPFCGRNRCMQHGNMGCFDAKEATKRLLK